MSEGPRIEPLAKGEKGRGFAILPAAGRSARMGTPKLLLPFDGEPLIARVLSVWRASHVDRIVLVVHPQDARLAELGRAQGADVVVPESPPPDMKASVQHALQYLQSRWNPAGRDAWLVAPADMPQLNSAAIDAVLSAYQQSETSIVVPCHGGRRGHPVAFPWSLAPEVSRLGAHQGLNVLVARHPVREIDVPDSGILVDFDTPDDYRRLGGRFPD